MIKARFGDRLDGWLEAALPFLFRRPVNPNMLTVVGTLISVGAGDKAGDEAPFTSYGPTVAVHANG